MLLTTEPLLQPQDVSDEEPDIVFDMSVKGTAFFGGGWVTRKPSVCESFFLVSQQKGKVPSLVIGRRIKFLPWLSIEGLTKLGPCLLLISPRALPTFTLEANLSLGR